MAAMEHRKRSKAAMSILEHRGSEHTYASAKLPTPPKRSPKRYPLHRSLVCARELRPTAVCRALSKIS